MVKLVTVINSHTGKKIQLAVPKTTRIIQPTNSPPKVNNTYSRSADVKIV